MMVTLEMEEMPSEVKSEGASLLSSVADAEAFCNFIGNATSTLAPRFSLKEKQGAQT